VGGAAVVSKEALVTFIVAAAVAIVPRCCRHGYRCGTFVAVDVLGRMSAMTIVAALYGATFPTVDSTPTRLGPCGTGDV